MAHRGKQKARARRAVDIREQMEQRERALARRRVIKQVIEAVRAKVRRDPLPLQTNMQAAFAQVQQSEMPMGGVMCFVESEEE